MGFISGTSTVTVQAKLTQWGKRKLYQSIENNSSGFITKFALGDSDANYPAISAGFGTLAAGHVPEATDFRPRLRSRALYAGVYHPGKPVILIDGEFSSDGGIVRDLAIGDNQPHSFTFFTTTEWPKNEPYSEGYKLTLKNPGNISNEALNRLFSFGGLVPGGGNTFMFNGEASNQELETLIGLSESGNFTSIPILIEGKGTNAFVNYYIKVKE